MTNAQTPKPNLSTCTISPHAQSPDKHSLPTCTTPHTQFWHLSPYSRVTCLFVVVFVLVENSRYRIFTTLSHTYFSGHEISTYSGLTNLRCLSYCLSDYRCLSVNWNGAQQTDNCILNNATRWEDNEVLLTNFSDTMDPNPWNYYETVYPAYGI